MLIRSALIAAPLLALASGAQAGNYVWDRSGSCWRGAWILNPNITSSCWTSGGGFQGLNGAPDLGDNVLILAPSDIDDDVSVRIGSVEIETADVSAFQLSVVSLSANFTAEVSQSRQTFTAINEYIGTAGGDGIYEQEGGTHNNLGILALGFSAGTLGTYEMSNGNLLVTRAPADLVSFLDLDGLTPGGIGELIVGYYGEGVFNQKFHTDYWNPTSYPTVVADILSLGKGVGGKGTYNLENGELSGGGETVGEAGIGIFNQGKMPRATKHTAAVLTLGGLSSGVGTYNLASGELISAVQNIGMAGNGTLNQSGGSNNVASLNLGMLAGGVGTYNLSNGGLTVTAESIGVAGSGTFNQTGSSHQVVSLSIGSEYGSSGTYNLSAGSLNALAETIGVAGEGRFAQSGGTNTASVVTLGGQDGGLGFYTLGNGAILSADTEHIGPNGVGVFEQNAGTNTVGTLTFGQQSSGGGGFYTLNGGVINVGAIQSGPGYGAFSLNGGTINLTGSSYALTDFYLAGSANSSVGITLASGQTLSANKLGMASGLGSRGNFTLNGGTLNVGTITDGAGTSTFNLDGGTLNLSGASITVDRFNMGSAASFTLASGKTLVAKQGLNNAGVLANAGVLDTSTTGTLSNAGTLNNLAGGVLLNAAGASLSNSSAGVVNNAVGAMLISDGNFSNAGTLNNAGVIAGSSNYVQSAGQTVNDGSFTSAMLRINGGSLCGIGTISGNVAVAAGASILPGKLTETLTINGDFSNAGTFRPAVVAMDQYGKLVVSGTAMLGGDIYVDVQGNPALVKGQRLTSMIHAGAINGSFASVDDSSVLVDFIPIYKANDVDLFVRAQSLDNAGGNVGIAGALTTTGPGPGAGAASVLDSQMAAFLAGGTGSPAMDNLITQLLANHSGSNQQVSDAVSQTLPLLVGGVRQATNNAMNGLNRTIESRQDLQRGASSGDMFYGNKNLWFKPFGSWANQNDQNGTSGYRANSYGTAFGSDADVSYATHLGVAFSYANSQVDGNSSTARQTAHVNSYQLAFFGRHSLDEATELSFQVDIGRHRNAGKRSVVFLNQIASSEYDSWSGHIGAGLGHTLQLSGGSTFTPSLRADYTAIRDERYSETGSDANLDVDGNRTEAFVLSINGKLGHALTDSTRLIANLGVGYDVINEQASIASAFAGAPSASFVTPGLDLSPWLAQGGVGLVVSATDMLEISAHYDFEVREGFDNQTASIKANLAF